jgi:hypothetical protein
MTRKGDLLWACPLREQENSEIHPFGRAQYRPLDPVISTEKQSKRRQFSSFDRGRVASGWALFPGRIGDLALS